MQRRSSPRATVALALVLLVTRVPEAQAPRPLVVVGVTVIDPATGSRMANQAVTIVDGRVQRVGPARGVAVPRGAHRLDGTGKFLIPGLWDMHVHQAMEAWPGRPVEELADYFHPLFLASGVTGVRDAGGDLATLVRWQREVAAGGRLAPSQFVTGLKLGSAPVVPGAPFPVRTEADVRASVRMLAAQGAQFVKVDDVPRHLLAVVAGASGEAGLAWAGHVALDAPLADVAKLGQRSVEHLDGALVASSRDEGAIRAEVAARRSPGIWRRLVRRVSREGPPRSPEERAVATADSGRRAALARLLAARETWQVPTLRLTGVRLRQRLPELRLAPDDVLIASAANQAEGFATAPLPASSVQGRIFAATCETVGVFARHGVPMLAGTDTPSLFAVPGASLHDELELLVRCGLTPAQALASATSGPARFMGRQREVGTISPGARADLVLLDGDPLVAIGNTRRISAVIVGGRLLERRSLDSLRAVAVALVRRNGHLHPPGRP